MAPSRVLVHFGFHKTGTSSAERTLLANAGRLSGWEIVGRKSWPDVSSAAKAASRMPQDGFEAVQDCMATRVGQVQAEHLLITNVDLCGVLPGRQGRFDYTYLPSLLAAVVGGIEAAAPQAEITLLATQRPMDAWLKSLYWQNLKVERLRDDFATFKDRFQAGDILGSTIEAIRLALPDTPLLTANLQDADPNLGPASLVLSAAGIAGDLQGSLETTKPRKISPSEEMQAHFLEMNRSELSGPELKRVKEDALALLGGL
ncbi:MAG: hypothetical protein AAFZ02_00840 [Pseudomonadota bacterium]